MSNIDKANGQNTCKKPPFIEESTHYKTKYYKTNENKKDKKRNVKKKFHSCMCEIHRKIQIIIIINWRFSQFLFFSDFVSSSQIEMK